MPNQKMHFNNCWDVQSMQAMGKYCIQSSCPLRNCQSRILRGVRHREARLGWFEVLKSMSCV